MEHEYQKQIKIWIEACNILHSDTCVPESIPSQQPENVPRWLIDTFEHCIVPGLSANRYLALSYVWPETRGFIDTTSTVPPRTLLLDNETMSSFQRPGHLSQKDVLDKIPGVIKHAMYLTRQLGERYLWVDRLCIVQNDIGDGGTLSQVSKMDKIYSGAYITIIAAAHEEMYDDVEHTRWYMCESAKFSDSQKQRYKRMNEYERTHGLSITEASKDELISIMSKRYEALSQSRWATRGWTYQEQILCKRAVIFTSEGIFWDCQCSLWDGIDSHPHSNFTGVQLRGDRGHRFRDRWWPDFAFYLDLICAYNGREFSYSQDALMGMLGILNALAPVFPGGFVHGLPRLFLDHALLWQPFGIADRRVDRRDDGVLCSSLPSWSWAGWQGFVDPWSMLSGLGYLADDESRGRGKSWGTRNLVQWSFSIGDGLPSEIVEPQLFDQHLEKSLNGESFRSKDWKSVDHRGKRDARKRIVDRSSTYYHIQHPETYFEHPVPVLPERTPQPNIITPGAYLTCTTTTSSFTPAALLICTTSTTPLSLGESKISAFEDKTFLRGPGKDKTNPILVLQQPNGAFAGLIRLAALEPDLDASSAIRLIAISTGSARARDLRESLEWRIHETGKDSYYDGNYIIHHNYNPSFLSSTGKPALVFDLAMAFDPEAASTEPLGSEFEDVCKNIDRACHDEMNRYSKISREIEEDPEFKDLFAFKREVTPTDWFRQRARYLAQHARDPIVEKHGYRAQARMQHSYLMGAKRRWEVVRQMVLNGSFFEVWNSVEEGERLGDFDMLLCEWYNVLWVEERDEIMYRKACGWVPKDIWTLHQRGKVEVKLG